MRRDGDKGGETRVIGMWTGDSTGVEDLSSFWLIHVTDGPEGCSPGGYKEYNTLIKYNTGIIINIY